MSRSTYFSSYCVFMRIAVCFSFIVCLFILLLFVLSNIFDLIWFDLKCKDQKCETENAAADRIGGKYMLVDESYGI